MSNKDLDTESVEKAGGVTSDHLRYVMLIDNDAGQTRQISSIASREGWRTLLASSSEAAIETLESRDGKLLSAILLDQSVPGEDACGLIAQLKELRPAMPILMLTASTSPLLAVEAMRAGASDYLVKPVSPDRLMDALKAVTKRETERDELAPLTEKMSAKLDFEDMVGTAPKFRTALAQAAKAARGQGHVLIEGESGTGKEMLIRAMHGASPRSKAGLRIINIGSVPTNSIESMLFGHEPNAFPGAFDRQVGALQNADGATLVLDEVDRLPMSLQDRLAEALETGIVRPIGAQHGFRVDVRILAASNFTIADLVEAGSFSKDLAQLISGTRIVLPPLRERTSDIPALTRHFLTRIGKQPGLNHLSISDSAISLLSAFEWPGNVRQLQSALFRAAVYCEGDSLTDESFPHLSELIGDLEDGGKPKSAHRAGVMLYTDDGNLRPLDEIEADVIRLAIGHYRGRMTEVARRLGIGRSTLYRKLADLGIDSAA